MDYTKKALEVILTIAVLASTLVAYNAFTQGWGETLATARGIHGYILATVILVGIGSVLWLAPRRFLRSKTGAVLTTLFGGGTIGGIAVIVVISFLPHPTSLQIVCGLVVTVASANQGRLLWALMR